MNHVCMYSIRFITMKIFTFDVFAVVTIRVMGKTAWQLQ